MVKHSAFDEIPELEAKRDEILEAQDLAHLKQIMYEYATKEVEVLWQLARDTWRD